MSGRRSSHINFWCESSSDVFQIINRTGNAQMTGARFGWFKMEHDSVRAEIMLSFYLDKDDADPVAESVAVLTSSLPASVALSQVDASGVSGSVYIDGLLI